MFLDFGVLILAHLVGDYVLQTDTMASKKRMSSWTCAHHCLVYTLAIALIAAPMFLSSTVFAAVALATIFITHFLLDRFGLARRWMVSYGRQEVFATGALSPWSIIVIDNIFHLLVLFALHRAYLHLYVVPAP